MTEFSIWRSVLGDRRAFRDHDAWVKNGRKGPGRMVLVDLNLSGAQGPCSSLDWARLEQCDLRASRFILVAFNHGEAVRCQLRDSNLNMPTWDDAILIECDFSNCDIGVGSFHRARLERCRFIAADLQRGGWAGADVIGCDFRGASIVDSVFGDACFTNCDLRGADLRRVDLVLDLATAYGTRFMRCDLRGANIDGWRLRDTVFDACRLHGLQGRPVLEGEVTILDPDLSPGGTGGGSAEELLASWR